MKKFKYEIVTPNDNQDLATIVKRKVDVEFTMQQLKDQEQTIKKRITELTAKRDLEAAAMENIEHFHPFVKDFTEEQYVTLRLYTVSKQAVDEIRPVLEYLEGALKEHDEEVAEIKKQINYVEAEPS